MYSFMETKREEFCKLLQVGDKVVIRSVKEMEAEFGHCDNVPCAFTSAMKVYEKTAVTITAKHYNNGKHRWIFHIKEDNEFFSYSVYMFECNMPYFSPVTTYKIGDKIGGFRILQPLITGEKYCYTKVNSEIIMINGQYYPKTILKEGVVVNEKH